MPLQCRLSGVGGIIISRTPAAAGARGTGACPRPPWGQPVANRWLSATAS